MNTCVNEAARHLVKLEVFFDGKNSYSFNYEGKVKVFRGDIQALAKFLQSFKAKDNKTNPRSARGERYIDIANEITDGSDRIIYAWSNDLQNAFSRHESVYEALKPTDYDVFVFSNPTTQNLFIDIVKKWQASFTIKENKVFVDSNTILNHMSDLANFFDKYIDDFMMYSGSEYKFLISRGVKIESISNISRDGSVEVSNSDKNLISDLFEALNNNAYWVCDEKNMSCLKKDGTAIRIKGNFITIENGMMNIDIPYLKDTKFIVETDGMVSIILGNSNAIRGVINL